MCFESAQAPSQGASYGQSLAAQVKYAPQIYQENAQFSPLYTQLGLSNLSSFLNGTNGQPGFLSEYASQIMPALTSAQTKANTQLRTANLADAAALTPSYIATERAANPQAAGLLDTLVGNTNRDLSFGTNLTPAQQVQFNQSVRGGEAARGMGFGPSDVFNESLQESGYGQNLYQQRMQAAQSLVPQLQSFYGDPTGAISGMNSGAGMSASSLSSLAGAGAAPAQSSEFDPSALAMQNQSIGAQLGMANAGAENGGISAGLGAASKL